MNGNCPVHSHLLQQIPGEIYFANFFCQCSASRQPVGQWASTEELVHAEPQPNFPAPSSPINNTIIPPVTTTTNRWHCPICTKSFSRRQERDRLELTHVPYYMHCPLSHCTWRGNRDSSFKKHWKRGDHRSYHEHYGHTPERSQIETFDPWLILNQIIIGAISLREGEVQAIDLVRMKASQLQKPSMGKDPWGRNKRHVLGQAHGQTQAR